MSSSSSSSSSTMNKTSLMFRECVSEGFTSLLYNNIGVNSSKNSPASVVGVSSSSSSSSIPTSLNNSSKTNNNSSTNNNEPPCSSSPFIVTVSFVDVHALPVSARVANKFLSSSPSGGLSGGGSIVGSNTYYDNIELVLRRDFHNTLRNIPYQNSRSGISSMIDALPIQCVRSPGSNVSTADSMLNTGSGGATGDGTNSISSSSGGGGIGMGGMMGRMIYNRQNSNDNSRIPTTGGTGVPTTVGVGGKFSKYEKDTSGFSQSSQIEEGDWHKYAYCHVYIAPCDGFDHYRGKIRPAIQAFISQLESAASSSSSSSSKSNSHQNNTSTPPTNFSSAQYVIIYIPTGSTAGGIDSDPRRMSLARGVLAVRAAASRSGSIGGEEENYSHHSHHSHSSGGSSAHHQGGELITLSNKEKELYKKMQTDFPNGRVCLLTSIHNVHQTHQQQNSNVVTQLTQSGQMEWNTVLKNISLAIVEGFKDRCKKYDEEIRKLEREKMTTTTDTNEHYSNIAFFLLKESLAFTYEQMQLFSEAHLQYKELSVFVSSLNFPVTNPIPSTSILSLSDPSSSTSSSSDTNNEEEEIMKASISGNTHLFRKILHLISASRNNTPFLTQNNEYFYYYLFSREIHLLFQQKLPVEVLERSYIFVKTLYEMKKEQYVTSSKQIDAEAWALITAWDVKCAASCYFHFDKDYKDSNSNANSKAAARATNDSPVGSVQSAVNNISGQGSVHTSSSSATQQRSNARNNYDNMRRSTGMLEQEREASRKLSELLEFARIRLVNLGTLLFNKDENPLSKVMLDRPLDTFEEWKQWDKLEYVTEKNEDEGISMSQAGDFSHADLDLTPGSSISAIPPIDLSTPYIDQHPLQANNNPDQHSLGADSYNHHPFISTFRNSTSSKNNLFKTTKEYESKYLELSSAIISLYQLAGRHRFASRLLGEQAELYILRKDISKAERILSSIVEVCAKDQWDTLFIWRLFRLACCQRQVGHEAAPSYLRTLIQCFTPKMNNIAPLKVLELFQRDLEMLVQQEVVHEASRSVNRLNLSPFLESELFVVESSLVGVNANGGGLMSKSSHPLGYLRKKLVKYFCFVGEHLSLGIYLTSYLPKPIELDGVNLFLYTLEEYENLYRRNSTSAFITEQQSFRIITVKDECKNENGKLSIVPGKNEFQFQWIPMAVGQFVLASVELQWAKASFFHDSATLRRPIQGVQVLPSEPTQTLELNPLFLIPGFEQEIRLVFSSGQDIITSGTVEFICSDGLTVLPPGSNEPYFLKNCVVTLDSCGPDTTRVLKTLVKSDPVEGYGRKGGGKVQTLHVKLMTNYHHSLYNELTQKGNEPKSQPMSTDLEALVTTLDRPALTVYRIEAYALSESRVIVSVSLHCNTPLPFSLKEWDVSFPLPLKLEDQGDINQGLFSHPVAEGEELFFAFHCKRLHDVSAETNRHDKPILHVILQDDIGKTFRQVLTLNMDSFYDKMKHEDALKDYNSAVAILSCFNEEGVVGAPVHFTFEVDISAIRKRDQPLLYSITCDVVDWIISGNIRGIVESCDENLFIIEFIGIPTKSGVIKRFPEIDLSYSVPPNSSQRRRASTSSFITVTSRYPDAFRSLSYTNHMALAYPSTAESQNH